MAGGVPDIAYYHSYWKLAPDEALVIDATPPECEHWNFQLNNYWMESLDYRYYPVHVNKHTAKYKPGRLRAGRGCRGEQGFDNWIDTVGHEEGTMCWRWVRANENPEPKTRVVKLSSSEAPMAFGRSHERFDKPHRPVAIAIANRVGRCFPTRRHRPITVQGSARRCAQASPA